MSYEIIKDLLDLFKEFNLANTSYSKDIEGFKQWIYYTYDASLIDSVREVSEASSLLISSLDRYFDIYNSRLIHHADFFELSDFIYLVTLKIFGSIDEKELIALSVKGESTGRERLQRLLNDGWVKESSNLTILLTEKAHKVLENQINQLLRI